MKKYEKLITINEPVMIKERQELIIKYSNFLLNFMFENNPKFDYFMIRLKDSENSPFSKDLVLQWTEE